MNNFKRDGWKGKRRMKKEGGKGAFKDGWKGKRRDRFLKSKITYQVPEYLFFLQ